MSKVTDPFAASPQLMKQWMAVSLAAQDSLEKSLIELVKIRSSILNGCANCINMHTAEARAKGESEQRIYLLAAWHEAPVFTPRERAALGWTDALTRSEEHTSELQSLMRISYAVFCLKKKTLHTYPILSNSISTHTYSSYTVE